MLHPDVTASTLDARRRPSWYEREMDGPKWLPWLTYALFALAAIGFVNHWLGIIEGHIDAVLMGCAVLSFGAIFLLGGVFGKDFRWGEDGDGPPVPRDLGATIFIGIGLSVIALGLFILSNT